MSGGKTFNVALALQHQARIRDNNFTPRDITLPKRVRELFGFSRKTSKRALKRLEEAGLIRVDWRDSACHRVTLLGRWMKKDRSGKLLQYIDGEQVYGIDENGVPIKPAPLPEESGTADKASQGASNLTPEESELLKAITGTDHKPISLPIVGEPISLPIL